MAPTSSSSPAVISVGDDVEMGTGVTRPGETPANTRTGKKSRVARIAEIVAQVLDERDEVSIEEDLDIDATVYGAGGVVLQRPETSLGNHEQLKSISGMNEELCEDGIAVRLLRRRL
jgi:hypothetical protein